MQTFTPFQRLLAIKRYSPATIKTYVGLLTVFQDFVGPMPIQELDTPALLNHVLRIVEAKQYTYSSHKQLISAVALFLKEVHHRPIDFSPVYPTRRPQSLPEILSVREVRAILTASPNLKHRAMLTLIYALGLRSGELIHLRSQFYPHHHDLRPRHHQQPHEGAQSAGFFGSVRHVNAD